MTSVVVALHWRPAGSELDEVVKSVADLLELTLHLREKRNKTSQNARAASNFQMARPCCKSGSIGRRGGRDERPQKKRGAEAATDIIHADMRECGGGLSRG